MAVNTNPTDMISHSDELNLAMNLMMVQREYLGSPVDDLSARTFEETDFWLLVLLILIFHTRKEMKNLSFKKGYPRSF